MEIKDNYSYKYTYSAIEHEEVKSIREKYIPQDENKLEKLRRLDASVNRKATVFSMIFGIIGALIMGIGMSCCLVWAGTWFVPGIVIGVLGIALISMAYPVYSVTLKKERQKIAPEIIRLSDELLK